MAKGNLFKAILGIGGAVAAVNLLHVKIVVTS